LAYFTKLFVVFQIGRSNNSKMCDLRAVRASPEVR
jgi:hypothetical protein